MQTAAEIQKQVRSKLPEYSVIRTGIRTLEIQDPKVLGYSTERNLGRVELTASGFLFYPPQSGLYKASVFRFFPALEDLISNLRSQK